MGEKVLVLVGTNESRVYRRECVLPRCLRAPASLLLVRRCANFAPKRCHGAREPPARTTPGRVSARAFLPQTRAANFPAVCPLTCPRHLAFLVYMSEGRLITRVQRFICAENPRGVLTQGHPTCNDPPVENLLRQSRHCNTWFLRQALQCMDLRTPQFGMRFALS
jgi:hypothetical protein